VEALGCDFGRRGLQRRRPAAQTLAEARAACCRLLPRAHARAQQQASATEMRVRVRHPLLATPAGVELGGEGEVRSARAQQGGREGGDAAVGRSGLKRPRLPRGATVAAARSADATRSPAAAHSSPRPRGMARQWEGVWEGAGWLRGGTGLP
jgi:hypothetical protein